MWVTAILGASTSFIESTLAQKYRQPDPLYGGWRGGPAYYLHVLAERRRGKKLKRSVVAALFAVSGLICWCGISQVISNSVSSAFENAFHIPPLTTTLVLTAIAAVIVLRKNATVKSLDVMVPIMAVCYFVITVGIVLFNLPKLPAVFGRIFAEAFGLRQAVAGGFGAVLMNGVKRGLFSNEAGSVLVEHHLVEHAVGEVLAVRDRLHLALRLEPVHLGLLERRLFLNVREHLFERSQPVHSCHTPSRRLTPGQQDRCGRSALLRRLALGNCLRHSRTLSHG